MPLKSKLAVKHNTKNFKRLIHGLYHDVELNRGERERKKAYLTIVTDYSLAAGVG